MSKSVHGNMADQKRFPVEDGDFKVSKKTSPFINCVQVAIKPEGIAVRDSKDSAKDTLFFNKTEWQAFIDGVKNGEFDLK